MSGDTEGFVAAAAFDGAKEGYVYTLGEQGQGYYPAAAPEVTHKPDEKVLKQQAFVHEMMSEMEIDRHQENDKSKEMMDLMVTLMDSASKPSDGSDCNDMESAKAEIKKLREMAQKYPQLFETLAPPVLAEPPTQIEVFAEGAKVEGRHGGGPRWFNATVTKNEGAGGNSTYNLTYEDGDKEENVIRYRVRTPGDKERKILCEHEKVDARHGGGQVLFPARIKFVHDGAELYDLQYDDGDTEKGVKRTALHGLCIPLPK